MLKWTPSPASVMGAFSAITRKRGTELLWHCDTYLLVRVHALHDSCGHNLIAMSAVGVALAAKAVLETHRIPGKIVLLGTPGRHVHEAQYGLWKQAHIYHYDSGRRRRRKDSPPGEGGVSGHGFLFNVS